MLLRRFVRPFLFAVCLALLPAVGFAIDSVNLRSTDRPVGGTITAITKTDVTVNVPARGEQTIPANDILRIDWDGQPPVFTRALTEENGGNYPAALASYQEALDANPANANIRTDIQFAMARTMARAALADATQVDSAMMALRDFVNAQRNHYRFYDAQMWLGDVALASGDLSTADEAFSSVSNSPWVDYQMAGKIGLARVLVERNDLSGARLGFDEVVSVAPTDEATRERRLEAMVGQAHVMQLEQDYEQAVAVLEQVIDESTADDTQIQAEAYLRQGTCYQLMGVDPKQAIMAYLHVDVIPALAKESQFHAESLYHLTQLWGEIGDTARATDASDRLKTLYPDSEWATK